MNNKKTTKRALLSSVMAIVLCLAMLIGTTFAWFTDSASTAVNKIQAGTLDVALEMKSNEVNDDGSAKWVPAEGQTLGWVAADSRAQEQIIWEPGATYALPELRIVNKGNLALKYKVVFSAINGDEDAMKLAEVLDVSLNGNKVGTLKDALTSTDTDGFAHGNLTAKGTEGATSGVLKITVQMQTTAGNDYQGLSIGGIAVTLLATQDTVENDSFGNQYDKDAEYPAIVSEIATKYKADASVVPVGFVVEEKKNTAHDGINNITGTITIRDAESLLYFAYVLDPAAAYQKHRSDCPEEWPHTCIWYPGATARHIKLDADIDLANIVLPNGFGNMEDFDFDGQGHTIKNVTIRNSGNINIGLFQGRNRGISNLVVENVNVILTGATGDSAVGIVSSDASAKISDVTVKNSSVTGGKWTGGIVGYNYGDVINCTMENCIVSGQYKVGGVVGYVCGDSREITGNKLTNVTVKGENILSGKTLAIVKIVGNWNATAGNCKNNTFIGTTMATENIGLILNTVNQD